jgi:maltose O-acetyltransferase
MQLDEVLAQARVTWYRCLWTATNVAGWPELRAPALLAGPGEIKFDGHVILGWHQSPMFYSGYTYIEARHPHSRVTIGDASHLNNSVTIVSEGPGITIGKRCLMGPMVQIFDSDFHSLAPDRKASDPPRRAEVRIGDDVFIGASAMILKGVTVGAGSVIGAGAVISRDVPPASVVAGNQERVRLADGVTNRP